VGFAVRGRRRAEEKPSGGLIVGCRFTAEEGLSLAVVATFGE